METRPLRSDGWEHTVKIERLGDPEPVWRVAQSDRRSEAERHAEFKEWITDDFDPHVVDAKGLANNVDALAKKWPRKPASKRPRRP